MKNREVMKLLAAGSITAALLCGCAPFGDVGDVYGPMPDINTESESDDEVSEVYGPAPDIDTESNSSSNGGSSS